MLTPTGGIQGKATQCLESQGHSPGDPVNTQEKLHLLRFTCDATTVTSIAPKQSHIRGALAAPATPSPQPVPGDDPGSPSCRWGLQVGAGHEAGWEQHPSSAE